MARARNYFAWQGRLVTREIGRRVVEVGCGIGNFTGMLLDREVVVAADPEPECIELLKKRYSGRTNLLALTCAADRPDFEALARFHPDTCVCLNVLEHIEDDLAALRRMASVLVPGGAIVSIVPAFPALFGPIDRNLRHYRRYRMRDVRALTEASGLHIGKLHYMNLAGFFGWWMNAHIRKLQAQSPAQIAFFDRWIVPAMARIEDVVRPPFGQSIFAVLRKPDK
jgi:SAM-dependent methyltransferase